MITRPLLAVALEDIDNIKYPQYCTPKYDGIRCLIINGQAVSRNFKPQPNVYIRTYLSDVLPTGLDGELVLKGNKSFNDVQSKVMSFDGEPEFEYHIFDYVKDDLNKPYLDRMEDLKDWYKYFSNDPFYKDKFKLILPKKINNKDELLAYETKCLEDGFEGIMLRKPDGKYKCGRSTNKEGILLKLKRFIDSEAKITGFLERFHNENEQESDEFGLSKRSSCKANLSLAGTLGKVVVVDLKTNIEVKVGTGFNDELRQEIWDNQDKYLGQVIKYKYQEVGVKEKPRFPVFLGFRSAEDMD
jgi:DNA ligase 1